MTKYWWDDGEGVSPLHRRPREGGELKINQYVNESHLPER
jgi:hypothetical protein